VTGAAMITSTGVGLVRLGAVTVVRSGASPTESPIAVVSCGSRTVCSVGLLSPT
jgi:hypothetical protein